MAKVDRGSHLILRLRSRGLPKETVPELIEKLHGAGIRVVEHSSRMVVVDSLLEEVDEIMRSEKDWVVLHSNVEYRSAFNDNLK